MTSDADTALVDFPAVDPATGNVAYARALAAAFIVRVASATGEGLRQVGRELTGSTQGNTAVYQSSTLLRHAQPEIRLELERLITSAREDVIADGMRNVITERFPQILRKDPDSVLPTVAGLIDAGRISPLVAAEILKELGRIDDSATHIIRLWVLENALVASSPITRDGAGLGLARMGDRSSVPHLLAAIERESDMQLRGDLQLVLDELTGGAADGVHIAGDC